MTLKVKIVVKNGGKQYAVLPYKQFVALQKRLADAEDLLALHNAKRIEGKKRSIPLAEAKRRIGLT